MQLLAESGGTRTTWRLRDARQETRFTSRGLHPLFVSHVQIVEELSKVFGGLGSQVQHVHFYGAGCGSADRAEKIRKALSSFFSQAYIQVQTDLDAAVLALQANDNQAFAAVILGTGSHACWVEQGKSTLACPSLGFWLGDEGSAAYFGKRLLRDFLNGIMPYELRADFLNLAEMPASSFLQELYKAERPNKMAGALAPLLSMHREHAYVVQLLSAGFDEFIQLRLGFLKSQLPQCKRVKAVGGFACAFKELLQERMAAQGFELLLCKENAIDSLPWPIE